MATETISIHLTVTATPAAPRIPLTLPKDVSPCSLRKLVSEATKIPLDKLRLIFRGRLIGDDEEKNAVEEFKLEDGSVLHCMGKPEEVGEAPPTAAAAAAAAPVTGPAGAQVTMQPSYATNAAVASARATAGNSLQTAFDTLRSNNPPLIYAGAVTTLDKILNNIISNPMEEKYRRMRKQNPAFQKKLGGLMGGDAAMKGAGFTIEIENGEEVYVLHASADKWPQLVAAKTATEAAVRAANAAVNQANVPPPMMPAAASMPNFGGMPGMGMGAGMPGGMSAGVEQFLSDPTALQAMLQNPMVQNMMQNDPRFANNPMLRQSMEQLANNPAMAQQLAAMMRDPAMRQQMQSMMAGGMPGGMPGFGGGGMAGAPMGAANHAAAASQGLSGGAALNDEQLTEEEMLAEAIRRSLEEGGA